MKKRWLVAIAACLSVTWSGLVAPVHASDVKAVRKLHVGDSVFWQGPWVDGPEGFRPAYHWVEWWAEWAERAAHGFQPYCERWRCWKYRVEVAEKADRLRVALDQPLTEDYDYFWFDLYGPDGEYWGYGDGYWAQEAIVDNPARGTWKILVAPGGVTESTFRLRARLENDVARPKGKRLMAPNLRVEPPFSLGFGVPQYVHWLVPTWRAGEIADCNWDETLEDGARRCLRLSVGAQNVGDGPLELRYSSPLEAANRPTMYQRLTYSDGSTREREAGTYEYHKTHGHYHFLGFSKLDLYRVVDRQEGTLEHAGDGHKVGFCLASVLIAEWTKFSQAPAYSAQSDCSSMTQAWMGLSTGWTDVYTWDTPGNYVEFGDNPDGRYVIRAVVDPSKGIVETNENDNVGYAYIDVEGDDVTLIERGQGRHPWDPNKIVFRDWWRSD